MSHREKLVRNNFKRFFRTNFVGTISSGVDRNIYNGQENKCELKGLLIYNPKNNYLRSSSKKAGNSQSNPKGKLRRIANGCSSEKERKVNALALRAEEGRDYLR